METVPPLQILNCSQCGGELHPDEGQMFLTCPFCSSTVYVDKSRVVFHWALAPTLDEAKARGALARWMAGNQTVKDLDKKSRLVDGKFEYFPVWYFKQRLVNNKEEIVLEPAAATSVTELRRLNLPAGDLRKYDPSLDSQAQAPTVPLEAALVWAGERQLSSGGPRTEETREMALVHIPLYTFKYIYNNQAYTAIVEAGTGSVFANIFPAKAEAPYLLAGGLTALVFLCLAAVPLVGAAIDQESGATVGLLICSGVGALVAPVLFAFAAWVAAKI